MEDIEKEFHRLPIRIGGWIEEIKNPTNEDFVLAVEDELNYIIHDYFNNDGNTVENFKRDFDTELKPATVIKELENFIKKFKS